tara:strand:- start:426 stop:614 length:189 start_codon:yes stop_codon:yes gene_type:complete
MSNHKQLKNSIQQKTQETNLKLTKQELEVLLFLISNGTFKGTDIERIYKLAVKIQVEHDKLK